MSLPFVSSWSNEGGKTIENVKTIWQAITWLSSHRKYMGVGYVLAEYATKMALSYLPEKEYSRYSMILSMLGFDLESIGIGSIGKSIFQIISPFSSNNSSIAKTSSSIDGQHVIDLVSLSDHHNDAGKSGGNIDLPLHPQGMLTAALAQHDQNNSVSDNLKLFLQKGAANFFRLDDHSNNNIPHLLATLMQRIKSLGIVSMSKEQLNEGHKKFAKFLSSESGWAHGVHVDPMIMANVSEQMYHGSHWFEVGLSTLNQRLKKQLTSGLLYIPSEKDIFIWLNEAFDTWAHWGAMWTPVLDTWGVSAIQSISEIVKVTTQTTFSSINKYYNHIGGKPAIVDKLNTIDGHLNTKQNDKTIVQLEQPSQHILSSIMPANKRNPVNESTATISQKKPTVIVPPIQLIKSTNTTTKTQYNYYSTINKTGLFFNPTFYP